MCGIVGILDADQEETRLFSQMLYLSALRGMHATGIFTVFESVPPENVKAPSLMFSRYLKSVEAPADFIDNPEYLSLMRRLNKRAIIGHTRHATAGSKTVQNAHPFDKTHLIGVHNGTVPNNPERDSTDSEKLYESISSLGVGPALKKAESGAYALIWFDKGTGLINIIRNRDRPLHFARTYSSKILISSESRQLEFLGATEGPANLRGDPEEFKVHHLYQWNPRKPREGFIIKDLSDEIKPAWYRNSVWRGRSESFESFQDRRYGTSPQEDLWRSWEKDLQDNDRPALPAPARKPTVLKAVPKTEEKNVKGVKAAKAKVTGYKAYGGTLLSEQEMKDVCLEGCAFCQKQSSISERKRFITRDNQYLCSKCMDNPEIVSSVSMATYEERVVN